MTWWMIALLIDIILLFNQSLDIFLVPILQENDLENYYESNLEEFTLKRIKKSKIVFILLLFWEQANFSLFYFTMIFGLFYFFFKKDYIKLQRIQTKKSNLMKFQFPIWLRQLQILLQTNTVSQSLTLSLKHAPLLIQDDLKKLIEEINKDAIDITPYLNFLKNYRLTEIERAMKLLYRYNMIGKEDSYLQFNRMIQTTTKWLRTERKNHHKDSLAIYEWFSMIPLIGVTFLFLAIMCEVIMNMFSYM